MEPKTDLNDYVSSILGLFKPTEDDREDCINLLGKVQNKKTLPHTMDKDLFKSVKEMIKSADIRDHQMARTIILNCKMTKRYMNSLTNNVRMRNLLLRGSTSEYNFDFTHVTSSFHTYSI